LSEKSTYHQLWKWLKGESRLSDEQLLARQAEEDPFLAEAMEGYESMPEGLHEERVQRLLDRTRARTQSKKRRLLAYWPRAAAAVLVIGMAAFAFWYINPTGDTNIAQSEKTTEIQPTITPEQEQSANSEQESPAIEEGNELAENDTRESSVETEATPISPPGSAEPAPLPPPAPQPKRAKEKRAIEKLPSPEAGVSVDEAQRTADIQEETAALAEDLAVVDEVQIAEENEDAGVQPAATEPAAPPVARSKAMPSQSDSYRLRGQVIDGETGDPLIGASVVVDGTEWGATTDIDGQFELEVPAGNNRLIIEYIGYSSQVVEIGSDLTVAITMYPAETLLEAVTVTGYKKSRADQPRYRLDASAPEGGVVNKKFERYTRRKGNYPEPAENSGITGEVELSFLVSEQGRPVNVRVERSLKYGCDEEAVRLLQEGPDWENTSERIHYIFQFKK
jgi:TonB family protein